MRNRKIDPNLIASMISDEPTKFNYLQCTLVKYSDSIDELAEAVVRHDMVDSLHVLSEDIDILINEGPLDSPQELAAWASKKWGVATATALAWANKKFGDKGDSGASGGEGVSDMFGSADSGADGDPEEVAGEIDSDPETMDKQAEWEKKYNVVYAWVIRHLQLLSHSEKGALGRKPSWMMDDPDMQRLLKALSNELIHRSKGLKPKYYAKGAKSDKGARPGRSINKGYEGDLVTGGAERWDPETGENV